MKKLTISLLSISILSIVSVANAGPVIETIQTQASLWIETMNSTEIPEPAQFLVALAGIIGLRMTRRKTSAKR